MAAHNTTAPVEIFRDWEITKAGKFKNKVTKRELSRQEWEIEMSYEHYDNDAALAFAKVLADQASELAS